MRKSLAEVTCGASCIFDSVQGSDWSSVGTSFLQSIALRLREFTETAERVRACAFNVGYLQAATFKTFYKGHSKAGLGASELGERTARARPQGKL